MSPSPAGAHSPFAMPPLPLPLLVAPATDEAFRSYLVRLAAHYEVSLTLMAERVGLLAGSSNRLPGHGATLSGGQLAALVATIRLDHGAIEAMLLSRYNGVAIDLEGVAPGDAAALVFRAQEQWVYLAGSHFCPLCIKEEGAWKLRWKLPWSYACAKHQLLLVGLCPGCGKRAECGRSDRSLTPTFMSRVPQPGRCGNPQPAGIAKKGRAAVPCGYELSTSPQIDLSDAPHLLKIQEQIDSVLLSFPEQGLSERLVTRTFLEEMRSIVALILFCAYASDLGDLPEPVQCAFAVHVDERDRLQRERTSLKDARTGARQRVFFATPEDPALMAAAVPMAYSIVRATSDANAQGWINVLAERLANRRTNRWAVLEQFHFSRRLKDYFRIAYSSRAKFDQGIGGRSLRGQDHNKPTYVFESRHVPQLLPKLDFDSRFAKLLPGIQENHARRFCSMALVRLCGQYTWIEAAAELEIPVNSGDAMANRAVGVLRAAGAYESFAKELHRVAARLSAQPARTDYERRRDILCHFTDIPQESWEDICDKAGVGVGKSGGRSRYAGAWLWAELTGGDWRLAPSLADGRQSSRRAVFQRFYADWLPKLKVPLLAYGECLVR